GLQHAADPAGHSMAKAKVMNLLSVGQSTNTPGLDVDVATGSNTERLASLVHGGDALIQTDRCPDLLLQGGMIQQIVVGQWLLDHRQVEVIQGPKEGNVFETV